MQQSAPPADAPMPWDAPLQQGDGYSSFARAQQQATSDATADVGDDDAMREPITEAAEVRLAQRDRPTAPPALPGSTSLITPEEPSPSGAQDLKDEDEARTVKRASLLEAATVQRPVAVQNLIIADPDDDEDDVMPALARDLEQK
jgi:hypothetical protein